MRRLIAITDSANGVSSRLDIKAWQFVPPELTLHCLRPMLGENAAHVYDFDLDVLAPLVARIGPTEAEVAEPLEQVPMGASSTAFEPDPIKAW